MHSASEKLEGLVFDWDGTLVDSQTAYVEAFRATLLAHGYQMSAADANFVPGRAFPDCLSYFSIHAALESKESFEEQWRRDFNSRIEAGIPIFRDAVRCLEYAKTQALPVAIATQTPRKQFDVALAATNLQHLVPVSVCRDEVGSPKPAPDLYLEACRRIARRPSLSLAIEDSPTGAASARSAGLVVLSVVRNPSHRTELARLSEKVVDSLSPALVAELMLGGSRGHSHPSDDK